MDGVLGGGTGAGAPLERDFIPVHFFFPLLPGHHEVISLGPPSAPYLIWAFSEPKAMEPVNLGLAFEKL